MRKLFFLLLLCHALLSYAQIPVGHWRTHLNYSNVTQIAETAEKVYGVSDGALFSYNKEDQSVDVFTKVEGLNDTKVQFIAYSKECSSLIIVYDNCNIDILTEAGEIFNIPDIKNKNISNGKAVNRVNVFGKKAYLSMGYGISIVDLVRKEIADSYLLSNTNSISINSNTIYAATDKGIYTASMQSNLVDPSNWSLFNTTLVTDITSFQGNIYAVTPKIGLIQLNQMSQNTIIQTDSYSKIDSDNNLLIAYGRNYLTSLTPNLSASTIFLYDLYNISSIDFSNEVWIGTSSGINRLLRTNDKYQIEQLSIKPKGPVSNSAFKLKFSGEKLMVVGGGAWDDRFWTPGAIYFFENENWTNIKVDTIPVNVGVHDLVDIVEDPSETNHYFVASWGEGLYEFRSNKLVLLHTLKNSPLESVIDGNINYLRINGLCYDKLGNLFITNSKTQAQIKILNKKQEWTTLSYSDLIGKPSLNNVILTKKGQFWTLSARVKPGIFVFDPKTTLSNQNDDQTVFLADLPYMDNLELKTISPSEYYSIAEDKNGAIWIGTDMGPVIFNSPSKIFDTNATCSRVKVPRNDGTQLADYLLEEEKINAIAVDGGNRKWLGTENSGVYLVSDNGLKTIYHFTAENSPLLSNKIHSIAIHPTTGEVFIGTDKGLISFRGDATEGKKNYDEVRVFPNPIRPNYEGLITITGLRYQSTVRITDTVGNSIFEGVSEGGQFTWNGKNRKGEKVATGVYLVYAAISDATEGVVSKILVVK